MQCRINLARFRDTRARVAELGIFSFCFVLFCLCVSLSESDFVCLTFCFFCFFWVLQFFPLFSMRECESLVEKTVRVYNYVNIFV